MAAVNVVPRPATVALPPAPSGHPHGASQVNMFSPCIAANSLPDSPLTAHTDLTSALNNPPLSPILPRFVSPPAFHVQVASGPSSSPAQHSPGNGYHISTDTSLFLPSGAQHVVLPQTASPACGHGHSSTLLPTTFAGSSATSAAFGSLPTSFRDPPSQFGSQ